MEEGETPKDPKRKCLRNRIYRRTVDEKPLAESRYEISVNNDKVKKTVWFFKMHVVKAFDSEPTTKLKKWL